MLGNKLFILSLLLFLHCCNNKDFTNIKIIPFESTIYEIKDEIIDLTWVEAPLTTKKSVHIVKNPQLYLDSLVYFIKKNEHKKIEIEIGLVLMKNLDRKNSLILTKKIQCCLDMRTLKLWMNGFYGNKTLVGLEL